VSDELGTEAPGRVAVLGAERDATAGSRAAGGVEGRVRKQGDPRVTFPGAQAQLQKTKQNF